MRVAYLSPLPPARTGIAHYASMVLPALRSRFEVETFESADGYDRDAFDVALYQLGNNPHHEWIYREAIRHPGVAVLHDVVLHHLIVEMTLARGDADGYVAALRASHGEAGAAWARGRVAGLHSEMGNFLLPGSIELANRSRSVVVHNRWAADLLRSFGVATPIEIVAHPFVRSAASGSRDAVRVRLGFAPSDRVAGFFGFLTAAKRAGVVLEAFAAARRIDPALKLLVVGEPAPDIAVDSLRGEGITVTGFLSDGEFDSCYAATDLLVNLRYPSAGESSGTLIRAFEAGKPVAVSNYAQFAEYPDGIVTKIDLGSDEVRQLEAFLLADHDRAAVSAAQRRWLEENARLDLTLAGYARAFDSMSQSSSAVSRHLLGQRGVLSSTPLALFPHLELLHVDRSSDRITLELRNAGEATIRTRSYGTPAYRVLAKIFDGGDETGSRWLELPCDLGAGERTTLTLQLPAGAPVSTLRLYDALEGIPLIEPEAWASQDIVP